MEMELVLKRTEGKPPYIGILFFDRLKASRDNQDLFEYWQRCTKPAKPDNSLKIEMFAEFCHITLLSYGIEKRTVIYKSVKYNAKQLEEWLAHLKEDQPINFSHLRKEFDQWKAVKTLTGNYSTVIPIDSIETTTGVPHFD